MPPDVNVTYEAMENAARRLSAGHEEISTQLTELRAMVDDLVQSAFQTDVASKTFQEAYEEFNTGISKTIEGLDVMSRYLTTVVEKFREVDQSSVIRAE